MNTISGQNIVNRIRQQGAQISHTYQYKPGTYFSITFLATFVLWFAGAYASFQKGGEGVYIALMLPGLMAPFIISVVMIFTSKNADLKKAFWNRLINPKLMRPKMLPVLFLIMPLAVLASVYLSLPLGGSTSQLQWAEGFSFSSGAIPVLLLLLLAATFEELGWRGYAFDSLQSKYNFFTASLLFSVLWSLWHFPLIFVKDSYQYEIFNQNVWYGVNFFISIIPMGLIISWMCVRNGKSVLAAILFHFVINMSQEALAITQTTKCIETAVLFVVAMAIIVYEKKLFFSKAHLTEESPLMVQSDKSKIVFAKG